jgi:hypothetical protein
MLPHAEDRDDVGVVQPSRRASLALEPANLIGVDQGPDGQDLDGYTATQALLLGLVDDSHATATNLAQKAELAEPARRGAGHRSVVALKGARLPAGVAAEVLRHRQGGKQGEDLLGQVGVRLGVLLRRRWLAPPLPPQELLGQCFDRVATTAGC